MHALLIVRHFYNAKTSSSLINLLVLLTVELSYILCIYKTCLEATYDDHLGLIGKRVVDFLLVLIELFFAKC